MISMGPELPTWSMPSDFFFMYSSDMRSEVRRCVSVCAIDHLPEEDGCCNRCSGNEDNSSRSLIRSASSRSKIRLSLECIRCKKSNYLSLNEPKLITLWKQIMIPK